MKGKNGFTIVEMLMVVVVLSILIGIVTSASTSAIRQARFKRTQAMMSVLQAGLATYYTQKGEWPKKLADWCKDGPTSSYAKKNRVDFMDDTSADEVFRELASESVKNSPMLDVTGLFVAKASLAKSRGTSVRGMDFRVARAKKSGGGTTLQIGEMAFGYPEKSSGSFKRFIIKYNFDADSVSVMTQNESGSGNDYRQETGATWPDKPES